MKNYQWQLICTKHPSSSPQFLSPVTQSVTMTLLSPETSIGNMSQRWRVHPSPGESIILAVFPIINIIFKVLDRPKFFDTRWEYCFRPPFFDAKVLMKMYICFWRSAGHSGCEKRSYLKLILQLLEFNWPLGRYLKESVRNPLYFQK